MPMTPEEREQALALCDKLLAREKSFLRELRIEIEAAKKSLENIITSLAVRETE